MTLVSLDAPVGHALGSVSADPAEVRAAFSGFPSGVAALCAQVDGVPVGMVASSFTVGVSYSPPMVMFSVQNSSTTWPLLRSAERIGVSILGHDQTDACMQLASRSRDRFDGLDITVTDRGAVLIDAATLWLDCEIVGMTPAGDHHVVVLQVHELSADHERVPLVYHQKRFHALSVL